MAQPKDPPLSIRLPAKVLAAVDRVAEASGLKRHAVIVALVSEGVVCAEAKAADRTEPTPEFLAWAEGYLSHKAAEVGAPIAQRTPFGLPVPPQVRRPFRPHPKPGKGK